MKKAGMVRFAAGFILGALVFGGTAALAAGIVAQPKTADVVIDGRIVDLNGYLIEGSHYFQLRDLSSALEPGGKDFSIVWDGTKNQVFIDTRKGYAPDVTLPAPNGTQEPVMTLDEMKMEVIRLTNAERVRAGLPELVVHQGLMDSAQAKAQDFLNNNYYGHISPVYGTPADMIPLYVPNVRTYGENLATWTSTPQGAVAGWVDSPEHYRLMIASKYTHIGVGILVTENGGMCWVQQFIGF